MALVGMRATATIKTGSSTAALSASCGYAGDQRWLPEGMNITITTVDPPTRGLTPAF
jgi:hypothetical protein